MDLQQIWNDAIDRVAATISDEQKKQFYLELSNFRFLFRLLITL